jgi:Carboxypeptidase regulatory-like domain
VSFPHRASGTLFVVLIDCVLLNAFAGAGQVVGTTTGAINGTVTDLTGAVLPGVTIVVSSDALMRTQTGVTNAEGFYRFPALPPGLYKVAFALAGFRAVNREAIYIGVGFTVTLDVELDLASVQQDVVVEPTSSVIDKQSTAIITSFDARQLAHLPGARSMWAIQAATPGVHMTNFDVGGSAAASPTLVSVYGTDGGNRPMVEGISVAGINPTGFTLNYGSFEEVSVLTAAHTAEWQAPGVAMQFVSKSGGNQYRASLYADYENRHWQSFNIDNAQIARGAQGGGGLSPREANRLWGYHDINPDVGGYIKPDTLWWFFSFRDQEVSARRLNFPVRPYRTRLTNYSGKATYQARCWWPL